MNRISVWMLAACIATCGSAFAEDKGDKMPTPTKEQRAERAAHHDKIAEARKKMAECLRSDKAIEECRKVMEGMGMGRGGHHGGMGHGKGGWGQDKGEKGQGKQ